MSFRRGLRSALGIVFALLCACAGNAQRGHMYRAHAQRLVVLVPSLVEDVAALGIGSRLVGVCRYTGNIPATHNLPRVADYASVDLERIVALRPDLVIGIPSQARLLQPLIAVHIRVVFMSDESYADIFTDIATIGKLTHRQSAAQLLIAQLRAQTLRLQARTKAFRRRPRVFVALGTGPIFTVGRGSYIATLIALAGGIDAVRLDSAYPQYSAEALLRLQPDAIITDRSVGLQSVLSREPWRSLRAVGEGRVFTIRSADTLERPGPHYNEGLAWLISRLAPLAQ